MSHLCHVWFTEIYPKKAVSDGSNLDNNAFQMEVGIFQNLSELKISCVIFKMIAIFVPDLTQLQNWHHSHLMLYMYILDSTLKADDKTYTVLFFDPFYPPSQLPGRKDVCIDVNFTL